MDAETFRRVLVGVDGSDESREAARQASILSEPDAELTLLAVYDVAPPIIGGTGSRTPPYFDEDVQREAANRALENARQVLTGTAEPVAKLVRGNAWDELLRELARDRYALVAVGSHGTGRVRGVLFGSTATELIHKAPCSVLVAREAKSEFPRRIVAGVDGSPESAAAAAIGRMLADRFGADLAAVKGASGDPVDALATAASDADLLVVGSRGLRGLKSLGSVSERIAHRARCSVLIVRDAPR